MIGRNSPKKLGIYFQVEKLRNSAQTKLKNIKQKPGQPAIDVKIEIEQLWIEAGYADDGEKDKHILRILLDALIDPEIKLQYEYSLMPNKTALTIDQVLQVANVIALHKPKTTSYHTTNVNKIQRGGGRGRGGRRFNYSNRFRGQGQNSSQQRCYNCNSNSHRSGDRSCPAIGRICRGCSKKGHFQAACKSSGQGSNSQVSGHSSGFRGRGRGRKFGRGRNSFHSRKATEEEEQASSSNSKEQEGQDDQQRQLAELLANSIHI